MTFPGPLKINYYQQKDPGCQLKVDPAFENILNQKTGAKNRSKTIKDTGS